MIKDERYKVEIILKIEKEWREAWARTLLCMKPRISLQEHLMKFRPSERLKSLYEVRG